MGLSRVNNNLSAQSVRVLNNQITPQLQQNLERLASGLRLNRAADDAAGLTIANRLHTQLRSLSEALDAAQTGINLLNIGDQALGSITERLQRINELTLQASNTGVNDQQAVHAIQHEINQNIDEINRIAETTQFGGQRLLTGEFTLGAEQPLGDMRANALGLGAGQSVARINVTRDEGVDEALRIIDAALRQVDSLRTQLGAISNRLESTVNNLSVTMENLVAARSRITDADFARETAKLLLNELMMRSNLSLQGQATNLQSMLLADLLR